MRRDGVVIKLPKEKHDEARRIGVEQLRKSTRKGERFLEDSITTKWFTTQWGVTADYEGDVC